MRSIHPFFAVAAMIGSAQLHASIVSIVADHNTTGDRATNLFANGSFEIGAFGNQCISGSLHDGFCPSPPNATIPSWTFTGDSGSYGWWGPLGFAGAPPADGSNDVYFGNFYVTPNETPTFASNGVVTWPDPGTLMFAFGPNISHPTMLSQTISGLTPGDSYALDFFTTGEYNGTGDDFPNASVFGLQISGESLVYLTTPAIDSQFGSPSIRYHVILTANATSESFTWMNWGHICSNCTELVVDDVILSVAPEPATLGLIAASLIGLARLRRVRNR